jgi:phosphodiesterase/alkaline phosphatase D-like protein
VTEDGPSGPEGLRFEFPDGELDAWLAIGDVTDRSVRAWARLPAGRQSVVLAIDGEPVVEAMLEPDPARDHVAAAVLALPGPRPETAFTVATGSLVRNGRLAPSDGSPTAFRFAFGSCHQPFRDRAVDGQLERHPGAAIYDATRRLLAERDGRFTMLLGDQVYSDAVSRLSVRRRLSGDERVTDEVLVETYRHLHRGYFNERGFRELNEALPAYLTWDDHDIFDGAGSLLHPTDFDTRLRRAAATAYVEYQHLRNPGASTTDEPPFDYRFWYGDVGFFVLDLRGCRDFHARRLLGDEQWARLDAFLAEADERDAATLFVASSVPVVHASPALMTLLEGLPTSTGRDIRDRWAVPHFRHERQALLERLFGWQVARPRRQVAVLSGDVHVGAAFRLAPRGRDGRRGRIAQWTSSALSTPSGIQHVLANRLVTSLVRLGEPSLRIRRVGLVATNNVGLVEVEPQPGGGHTLTFRAFAWDARRNALREALTDRSVARG